MKRFFYLTACMLAAFSCAKVETELDPVTEPDVVEYISIPITSEEPDTKAYYYEDSSYWTYLWEDDDTFNYFYYSRGDFQGIRTANVTKSTSSTLVNYAASDLEVGNTIYSYFLQKDLWQNEIENDDPTHVKLIIPTKQVTTLEPEAFRNEIKCSFSLTALSLDNQSATGAKNGSYSATIPDNTLRFRIDGFRPDLKSFYKCKCDNDDADIAGVSNFTIDDNGEGSVTVSFDNYPNNGLDQTTRVKVYLSGDYTGNSVTVKVMAHRTDKASKNENGRKSKYTTAIEGSSNSVCYETSYGPDAPYPIRDAMPCASKGKLITSNLLKYPEDIANSMTMYMLGSAAEFRIYSSTGLYTGETIKKVVFTKTNGNCAGYCYCNLESENLELTGFESNVITSDVSACNYVVPTTKGDEESVYMVLAAGLHEGTMDVVTEDPDGQWWNYRYQMSGKTFTRANRKPFAVNLESTAAVRTPIDPPSDDPEEPDPFYYYEPVTEEPASWEGTYLIVNTDDTKAFKPVQGSTDNSFDVIVENGIIIANDIIDQYAITITDAGAIHPASPEGLEEYDFQDINGQYMMWSQGQLFLENTIQHSNSSGTYTYHHTLKYENGVQVMSAQIDASTTNCYYMTYDSQVFSYAKNATGNRVHLYKYVYGVPGEPSVIPDDPDPVQPALTEVNQGSFELVNSYMRSFISDAEAQYTDANRTTVSLVSEANRTKYGFGGNGDLYQSGTNIKANDKPLPVTLSLDNALNGSNVSVAIYNDSAKTNVETTVSGTVSNSEFEIFNLIPGRTYYYTVTKNSEDVAIGYFQTTGTRRIIKVSDTVYADNANNCRDLGGLPTTDGKHIKYGKIFRGTNIDETTAAEQAILTGYLNIGLDVDLRGASSDKTRNIARQKITSIAYDSQKYSGASDLLVGSKVKNTFTAIFDAVASGKACYIHCFAGADRTGYICSIIAALCGVSSKEITIDYELTSFSCVDLRDRCGKVKNEAFAKDYPTLENFTGSTLKEKAENLLVSYGLDIDDIHAFQNAMIE